MTKTSYLISHLNEFPFLYKWTNSSWWIGECGGWRRYGCSICSWAVLLLADMPIISSRWYLGLAANGTKCRFTTETGSVQYLSRGVRFFSHASLFLLWWLSSFNRPVVTVLLKFNTETTKDKKGLLYIIALGMVQLLQMVDRTLREIGVGHNARTGLASVSQ